MSTAGTPIAETGGKLVLERDIAWTKTKCPIWDTDALENPERSGDFTEYFSSRAGGYFLLADSAIGSDLSNVRIGLSLEIAKRNASGAFPKFGTHDIGAFTNVQKPRLAESYNYFLAMVISLYPKPGQAFHRENLLNDKAGELAAAVSGEVPHAILMSEEIEFFVEVALQKEHLILDASGDFTVSIEGHEHVASLGTSLSGSTQIFVAMWFGDDKTDEYYNKAVKPAIEAAGYVSLRLDDSQENGKIDDQIIAEIRKSKALLCDITCGLATPQGEWSSSDKVGAPRGGVFYEAGFAHGLGLPIIWTVRDDVADVENVSHFDVRQFNQIRWDDDLEEARNRLQSRIEATLGRPNS